MLNKHIIKSFGVILMLAFISLGTIGGCNDGGGEGGLSQASTCQNLPEPCMRITSTSNADETLITCEVDTSTCSMSLEDLIKQVVEAGFATVTTDTPMWI